MRSLDPCCIFYCMLTVLPATVSDQYFCTKHPDLNICNCTRKNQAGIKYTWRSRNNHLCIMIKSEAVQLYVVILLFNTQEQYRSVDIQLKESVVTTRSWERGWDLCLDNLRTCARFCAFEICDVQSSYYFLNIFVCFQRFVDVYSKLWFQFKLHLIIK